MNKKGKSAGIWGIAAIALVCTIVFGGFMFAAVSQTGMPSGQDVVIQTESAPGSFSGYDVEFSFAAGDGSDAQDAEADLDIDILVWDETKNEQLAGRSLSKPKYYLDCAGVVPAKFDGNDATIKLKPENYCQINVYKFWAVFTAGDSETYLDDVLELEKADMDDTDGTGTMYQHVDAGVVYLVTVTEASDSDEEDVIPFAFLFTSVTSTTFDREELENGNINVNFAGSYHSDATAHSKLQISGECEDNQGNNMNLDSSLDGAISSSLTTATTINLDCDIEVEVTEDGYAQILRNPLAESQSEKPYLVLTPYGENATIGTWTEYGTGSLTGDVAYSASNVDTAQILWESSTACGVVLTDDSATDAVKNGNEKLRDLSCLQDIYDDGAKIVIPVSITQVKVDYDLATAANDEVVSAASGSSAESFFDVDLVGLESTSDMIAQTLSG